MFAGVAELDHFNPRSLTGATTAPDFVPVVHLYFNPRSLTGATGGYVQVVRIAPISIHAPSRERLHVVGR